jgi:hypothetical protein
MDLFRDFSNEFPPNNYPTCVKLILLERCNLVLSITVDKVAIAGNLKVRSVITVNDENAMTGIIGPANYEI